MKKPANLHFSNQSIQAALFFLFSFLLPAQLGKHFFFPFSYVTGVRVDYLAPTLYLTDILAVALILLNLRLFTPLLRKKYLVLFLALALAYNWFFSLSKPLFLYNLVKSAEAVAVFIVFAGSGRDYKKPIIAGLACATFVQLPLVISQLVVKHSLQGVWYLLGERLFSLATPGIAKASLDGRELLRPYGTFSHPNSLAGFFLLVELFFLTNRNITNLTLKYAVIFVSSFMVMVSFSKNAILVYLLLNLIYAWREKGCRLCIAASVLTSLAVASLFLTARTDILSFEKRITLAIQSLTIISRYPATGVGLGNYLLAQAAFPIKYSYFFLQPVHNIILLAAAELGLPLAAAGIFFLIRFLKKHHSSMLIFLLAAIFLTGMSDHYWLTLQQNILLGASLLGLVMYNNHHGTQKTPDRN